jgi:hypothetical protein
MRRQPRYEQLPRRELLEALVRHYHHLRAGHESARPNSSVRRRIESRLLDVRERFDHALAEWVPDDGLAQAWREHLHYRAREPNGPAPIQPLVFTGRSQAGSVAEVREHENGELHVIIDGSPAERIRAKMLVSVTKFRLVRPNRLPFFETFRASARARRELRVFLREGGSPPWDVASELLADGLIDVHFALTPRGRRALAALTRAHNH